MLHEADGLAVKMQVSEQGHVSICSAPCSILVPPVGFEPALTAPEGVAPSGADQRKRAHVGGSYPVPRCPWVLSENGMKASVSLSADRLAETIAGTLAAPIRLTLGVVCSG